jgi:laccase
VATLSWPGICQPGNISITAVDGVPGPVIEANEGDTVVVHVINESPHDVTVHWYAPKLNSHVQPRFQQKRSPPAAA